MLREDVWVEAYKNPHETVAYGLAYLISKAKGHVVHFTVTRLVKAYILYRYGREPPRPKSARHFTYISWLLRMLCTRGWLSCDLRVSRAKLYYISDKSPLWTSDPERILAVLPRVIVNPNKITGN